MIIEISEQDLEALDTLIACGPPEERIESAIKGVYESWHTEGDDFGGFCYGLEVVRKIVLDSDLKWSFTKLHEKNSK